MFYACAVKFDVMKNLVKFWVFGASKQGVCLIDRPCLVHPENQKVFKISRHIESCGTCMKH